MELSLIGWALSLLAAVAVGLSKGGVPMLGMLAVPLMALVLPPVQAAGILLPVFLASDLAGLAVWRRAANRAVLAQTLPGALVGVALGAVLAAYTPEALISGLVGAIGAAFALGTLRQPAPSPAVPSPAPPAMGQVWGGLAGLTSFISHAGAPPWQIFVQPLGLSVAAYAGTTTIFFAVINAAKLPAYAALGLLSPGNLALSACLAIPAIIAVRAGAALVRRIPARIFFPLITWALLAISLKLLSEALFWSLRALSLWG